MNRTPELFWLLDPGNMPTLVDQNELRTPNKVMGFGNSRLCHRILATMNKQNRSPDCFQACADELVK